VGRRGTGPLGGEESNIRVYRVGAKVCREVAVLRGYLSSVECLAVQDVGRVVVLVEGGGRGGVINAQGDLQAKEETMETGSGEAGGGLWRGGDEIPGSGHQVGGGRNHAVDGYFYFYCSKAICYENSNITCYSQIFLTF
jgi:hypothetical protein